MKVTLIDGLLSLLSHLQNGISIFSSIIKQFRDVNKKNYFKLNYSKRKGDNEINLNFEFEKIEKKN